MDDLNIQFQQGEFITTYAAGGKPCFVDIWLYGVGQVHMSIKEFMSLNMAAALTHNEIVCKNNSLITENRKEKTE